MALPAGDWPNGPSSMTESFGPKLFGCWQTGFVRKRVKVREMTVSLGWQSRYYALRLHLRRRRAARNRDDDNNNYDDDNDSVGCEMVRRSINVSGSVFLSDFLDTETIMASYESDRTEEGSSQYGCFAIIEWTAVDAVHLQGSRFGIFAFRL